MFVIAVSNSAEGARWCPMALCDRVIIVVPDIPCFCAKPRSLKLLKVHNGKVKSRTLNNIL